MSRQVDTLFQKKHFWCGSKRKSTTVWFSPVIGLRQHEVSDVPRTFFCSISLLYFRAWKAPIQNTVGVIWSIHITPNWQQSKNATPPEITQYFVTVLLRRLLRMKFYEQVPQLASGLTLVNGISSSFGALLNDWHYKYLKVLRRKPKTDSIFQCTVFTL
jgi:hypothetical protein